MIPDLEIEIVQRNAPAAPFARGAAYSPVDRQRRAGMMAGRNVQRTQDRVVSGHPVFATRLENGDGKTDLGAFEGEGETDGAGSDDADVRMDAGAGTGGGLLSRASSRPAGVAGIPRCHQGIRCRSPGRAIA